MADPYKGEKYGSVSCTRTIEHFRQTRRFSCWLGRNSKADCGENHTCIYHPGNSDEIKNKCDLSKGVIWKRFKPNSPFSFGANYISVVDRELLNRKGILLKPLLSVFYPLELFNKHTIEVFQKDFNFEPEEMMLFIV
jgi:hypothetical protein